MTMACSRSAIRQAGAHAGALVRYDAARLARGDVSGGEWWSGSAWVPESALGPVGPAFVLDDAGAECSIHFDARTRSWVHVASYGFGASTMGQNPYDRQTLSLAFPGVTMDAMPAGSGGRSARLDENTQARVEERQRSGPWRMAAGMTYDDVIDPRDLRTALISGLELCEGRRARAGRDR